jgi:hypothetical protein
LRGGIDRHPSRPFGAEGPYPVASAIFSGIAMALSVWVFFGYDKTQAGLQFVEKVP